MGAGYATTGVAMLGLNRMLHDPVGKTADAVGKKLKEISPFNTVGKEKASNGTDNNGYDHHSDKTSSSSSTHINSSSDIKNYTEDYTNSKAKFDTESKNMDILQKEKILILLVIKKNLISK